MKVGFVGAGSMAGAIARGVVKAGVVPGTDIVITSRTPATRTALATTVGGRAAWDATEVAQEVDVLVLAVKPHQVIEVLTPLREVLAQHSPLVVSVAAGVRLEQLAAMAPRTPMVRAMPNVTVELGAGVTALCATPETTADQRRAAVTLFEAVGTVVELDERVFPAFTAVAGSGPAFTATFVEALARAAVRNGIPKTQAVHVATQMLLGSARMLLESVVTPTELADMVASPGGTTIAGLCAMDEAGFSPAVLRGVQAAIERDRQMGAGG